MAYGETGSATLACTAELADGYSLEPADSADNCWVLMALSDGKSWNLGRELEVKLPADLQLENTGMMRTPAFLIREIIPLLNVSM